MIRVQGSVLSALGYFSGCLFGFYKVFSRGCIGV